MSPFRVSSNKLLLTEPDQMIQEQEAETSISMGCERGEDYGRDLGQWRGTVQQGEWVKESSLSVPKIGTYAKEEQLPNNFQLSDGQMQRKAWDAVAMLFTLFDPSDRLGSSDFNGIYAGQAYL